MYLARRADRLFSDGVDLALYQGFVGVSLAFVRHPGPTAFTFYPAFLEEVLDALKVDVASGVEGEISSAGQPGGLVGLVVSTEQGEVAAGVNGAAYRGDDGAFVALIALFAEAAFFAAFKEVVSGVLRGKQEEILSGNQGGVSSGGGVSLNRDLLSFSFTDTFETIVTLRW
ncbi:hypothetical protein FACS1894158_18740 [Betaproteobacteria bacterium]|nr:hypothetical protein FACS1894158_18740 [Betaproteobacteria bacterium]